MFSRMGENVRHLKGFRRPLFAPSHKLKPLSSSSFIVIAFAKRHNNTATLSAQSDVVAAQWSQTNDGTRRNWGAAQLDSQFVFFFFLFKHVNWKIILRRLLNGIEDRMNERMKKQQKTTRSLDSKWLSSSSRHYLNSFLGCIGLASPHLNHNTQITWTILKSLTFYVATVVVRCLMRI